MQHYLERLNGDLRFVWGLDYFLTLPDTRGTILSDKNMNDYRDNNGNGEAGSPNHYFDEDDSFYETGEPYRNIDSLNQISNYSPVAAWGSSAYDANIFSGDNVTGAVKDGLDNDRDSDDFSDVDGNGFPWTDNNGNGLFDVGIDAVEAGARLINGTHIFVYADGIDNDGDGKIDENIDEGIDEASEDNRYKVNEFGAYYQLNWKINDKLEFIQATRLDVHDRLTNFISFNNDGYNDSYSPLNWNFNFDKTDGLQISPKFGLSFKPKENQNYRLTWARAFNTPRTKLFS